MLSTVLLILIVVIGGAGAAVFHFHIIGKEPSPFELKDEHVVRMEANIPVEGPADGGKRKQGRRAIVLTDKRLVIFRWGKERVIDIPHELAADAPVHPSGHRLAIELRSGGRTLGRQGLYLVYTAKPALWAAEIRRWREIVGTPEDEIEEGRGGGDGGT